MAGGLKASLPRLWYRRRLAPVLWPLLPLSWLFRLLVALRRRLYRCGWLPSFRLPAAVIVVGNLTVGGSGKTPLVLWLAARLQDCGWRPGIISRGYGGKAGDDVLEVTSDSSAERVGDEPLLLARRSGVPVVVGRNRVAAGKALLHAHPECDVLISDDGLQHYRLKRSAELVVFDGRRVGNGQLLPAGPLREPVSRLAAVTALVWNGGVAAEVEAGPVVPGFSMHLVADGFHSLNDRARKCSADDLRGKTLHAIAGIGDPARFFAQLTAQGLEFVAHPFPDHHAYRQEDFAFANGAVLLMTEKDAVKCAGLALPEAWVLPVEARVDEAPDGRVLMDLILEKLNGCAPA